MLRWYARLNYQRDNKMNENESILKLIVVVIAVATYCAASYKAGFLLVLSPKSGTQKWEVRHEKISSFIVSIMITFGFSYLITALLLGVNAGSFGYAFLLTFMITFCLLYWILLETPVKYHQKGVNKDKRSNEWQD